ncbi:LacI family DNA-binding transcriptional regulator [Vibrio nigripulchritudo]|uniref:LacI family DNA-binding transcriptional regulator n=1 Tax=Vibrio nigripulchritudo TaxID=28173 RepID=UPI0024914C91|nr:LacI family DNA-binding transcriptional regulator [Vibrio nigripulchritudo]BDU39148.1 LacI family transcriptional regulator [Vibrio nigripulchritudo]BDU44868.1 LacI family transcriptional regulator [Vibrio nigripulchritudo]
MNKRVTIKSIANELGISHMTVSRALADSPKVKPDTKKLIQEKAAEMGYIPNQAAVSIRGGRSGVVGLLIPNIENEFYAAIANQMSIECARHNLQLMIGLTQDDPQEEVSAITRLLKHSAMSVVMVPTPNGSENAARLLSDVDTIQLIRTRQNIGESAEIVVNESNAFEEAVVTLTKAGCQNIAYIGGPGDLSTGRIRLESTQSALTKQNLPLHKHLTKLGAPSFELGLQAMNELLEMEETPDAVITAGFEISNGALTACLEKGVCLPESMRFVGYGDPSWYQWVNSGISTISISMQDIVDQCMTLLIDYQSGQRIKSQSTVYVEASLVRRHSA